MHFTEILFLLETVYSWIILFYNNVPNDKHRIDPAILSLKIVKLANMPRVEVAAIRCRESRPWI